MVRSGLGTASRRELRTHDDGLLVSFLSDVRSCTQVLHSSSVKLSLSESCSLPGTTSHSDWMHILYMQHTTQRVLLVLETL